MAEKIITVKVAELVEKEESGRGIVRIDSKTMMELGIREGDVIELQGKSKTGAIAVRPYPADIGLGLIRMDGFLRRNAGVGVGEIVKVTKADVKEAKKVVLAPTQKGIPPMNAIQIKRNLYLRPVAEKDVIVPYAAYARRRDPWEEVMDQVFSGFYGQASPIPTGTSFAVVATSPSGIVRITDNTTLEIKPEPVATTETRAAPSITYEDIGGLGDAVQKIRELVELPLRHPELFEKLGIAAPRGILLYGPPGTGKTLIAKAVANESGASFHPVSGPEFMSKFYGESEANLRKIFDEAEKNAPSIIFIDEIDAVAPKREEVTGEVERRVVSQLLTLLDGMKSRGKVIVIGATNRQNSLDPALRRPGRLDREVEIGVPDEAGRKQILQIHTKNMPLYNWEDDKSESILAERLDSFENQAKKRIEKAKADAERYRKDGDREKAESLQQSIRKVEADVETVKRVSSRMKGKSKDILASIAKEINDVRASQKPEAKSDETLKLFSERIQKGSDKEKKDVCKDLLDAGVISKDYIDGIIHKSLESMIAALAAKTYGYVGADLEALAKEAAMAALRRILPGMSWQKQEELPEGLMEKLQVMKTDFDNGLNMVEPSGMREVLIEIPKVKWDDVGGLDEVKETLREIIEWPLKSPETFEKMGIKPPTGVLFYGPPGCGKTLIAKAVATEAGANFIAIRGPEIASKWVGESEKHIREIFRRAKQVAPAIIFFDEIDSIAASRGQDQGSHVYENIVSQILVEMSGIEDMRNVVVIAATNRPDIIDNALLRPGRFERQLLIPAPDQKSRERILGIHTKSVPLVKGVNVKKLAAVTDGYTGADLEALVREAAMGAIRRSNLKPTKVEQRDFDAAVKVVRPSITPHVMEFYKNVAGVLRTPMPRKKEEEVEYIA